MKRIEVERITIEYFFEDLEVRKPSIACLRQSSGCCFRFGSSKV